MSAQGGLDIFQKQWCAVQSSLATANITAVLDFVVTVNSLCLKCLWLHHLCARFYLSIFFTPLHRSLLSPLESARFLLIPHSRCSSLFLPVTSPILWKVLPGKKLNINLPVFFWVKCKMKYSRTSQGCTSAGFHGNCRAVFSSVVSLRLALCFQPREEGRVRTDPSLLPRGLSRKWGNISHQRQTKSFSLRRDRVMNSLPCRKELMLIEGTYNQTYQTVTVRDVNRH